MYHMDLIICNSADRSTNLSDPIILAAETFWKNNLHLGEAMKADDRENFMKAMGKEVKHLTAKDVW